MAPSNRRDDSAVGSSQSSVAIKLHAAEYDLLTKGALLEELEPARNAVEVTIDCSSVEFMDSTALNCLVQMRSEMNSASSAPVVRLTHLRPNVQRLFTIAGLSKIFDLIPEK